MSVALSQACKRRHGVEAQVRIGRGASARAHQRLLKRPDASLVRFPHVATI